MAAALLASLYSAPTEDVQPVPHAPYAQTEPIPEPSSQVELPENQVPEARRIYWERVHSGRAFGTFIESLMRNARDNSHRGGRETARLYVISDGNREQVLDAEEIASSNQVFLDYDAIWNAIRTNGAVLVCHTHPFDEQIQNIENRRYVIPPSRADIEGLLNDVEWATFSTLGNERRDGAYRREFSETIRQIEACVATPGRGYWRMRVSNARTALTWLRAHSNDRSYREASTSLLRPLRENGFLNLIGNRREYTNAFQGTNAGRVAVLVERDLLSNTLRGEAREQAERFMHDYYEFRVNRDRNLPGPEYARFNEVMTHMLDTVDMAASEDEYRIFQAETLRLFGIEIEWVTVGGSDEETDSPTSEGGAVFVPGEQNTTSFPADEGPHAPPVSEGGEILISPPREPIGPPSQE